MNRYGQMARDHWARWLPAAYAAAGDPETFFTDLGERAETAIGELASELAGDDRPGEGYLGKVNRLAGARAQAEATVLAQMVLLEPEPEVTAAEEAADREDWDGQDWPPWLIKDDLFPLTGIPPGPEDQPPA